MLVSSYEKEWFGKIDNNLENVLLQCDVTHDLITGFLKSFSVYVDNGVRRKIRTFAFGKQSLTICSMTSSMPMYLDSSRPWLFIDVFGFGDRVFFVFQKNCTMINYKS